MAPNAQKALQSMRKLEIASIIRTRSRIRAKIHTAELSQHDAFGCFLPYQ
jgi:hypothetical protein